MSFATSNRLTNCYHRHGLFAASRFDCAQDERDERIIRELHLAQFDTPEYKAAVEEYFKKEEIKWNQT
jgi:hypothetical protein